MPDQDLLPPDWFLRVRLKLRHLQLFAALDTHRNLHRASAALGMPQPAASRLLGEVEDGLGVSLFDRLPRGIVPNIFGEVMIRRARMILSELAAAREEIDALTLGDTGTVCVGTVDGPAIGLLVPAVLRVRAEHPLMRIDVTTGTSDVLLPMVGNGSLDFALGRLLGDYGPSEFDYREIGEEPLAFICRVGHALTGKATVVLADLAELSWVLQPRGSLLRRRVESLFHAEGRPSPRQVINTRSLMMTLAFVERSDAIGVISKDVVTRIAGGRGLHILPMAPGISVEPYGLILSSRRLGSPATRLLVEAVEAEAGLTKTGRPIKGGLS